MKRIINSTTFLSLSLVAIIGVSEPAIAHNDELKTSPAAGSTIEAGRIPITLSFTEELLTDDESINHEVVITNESGIVPALCAKAKDFELTTAAAIEEPGKYTVKWRTVSADGHPISGSFDFNVENNTDYEAAADEVDACVYPMMIAGSETEGQTNIKNDDKKETNQDSIFAPLFIGAGFVGLLAVIGLVTWKTVKGRGQRHKNKNE